MLCFTNWALSETRNGTVCLFDRIPLAATVLNRSAWAKRVMGKSGNFFFYFYAFHSRLRNNLFWYFFVSMKRTLSANAKPEGWSDRECSFFLPFIWAWRGMKGLATQVYYLNRIVCPFDRIPLAATVLNRSAWAKRVMGQSGFLFFNIYMRFRAFRVDWDFRRCKVRASEACKMEHEARGSKGTMTASVKHAAWWSKATKNASEKPLQMRIPVG